MSFKWTEAEVRDANILDAKEFDKGYNAYKGVLNGGLDRENLPESSIAETHITDGALIRYTFQDNMRLDDDYFTDQSGPASSGPDGPTYDEYSGGWRTASDYIEKVFLEGMMHLEFNCWYWLNDTVSGSTVVHNYVEFQLLYNNLVVAQSGKLIAPMGQVHMVTDFPIPSGTGKIQLQWRLASPAIGIGTSTKLMWYDGGSLFALNRIR